MTQPPLDRTHDPARRSWVESANRPDGDFPVQNLPFGIYRPEGGGGGFRPGVAIGDQILDLAAASRSGLAAGLAAEALAACEGDSLNSLMTLGRDHWRALRGTLSDWLTRGAPERAQIATWLSPQSVAEYTLPARIGDYTDFYTSIHHARNVGALFRPDHPLLPNYQWVPIGYHGRSSSIAVSGQSFPRPTGQLKSAEDDEPHLAPSQRVDYELEVGIFVGPGNSPGRPIPIEQAEAHIFGLCLLNDWSARDLQAWEYQPLGPFLAKNFATTLSPWVVTLDALAPYRRPFTRPAGDPQPLPYLDSTSTRQFGHVDVSLEVLIETAAMRADGIPPERLACSNYQYAYWTMGQLIAHHTVNGCNLRSGDLLGSGTLSGPGLDQVGALLEATQGGRHAVVLSNGESRYFLEDGDRIVLRGWCDGAVRIGFGECAGTLLPAWVATNEGKAYG